MNLTLAKAVLGIDSNEELSTVSGSRLYGQYYWLRLQKLYRVAKSAPTNQLFDGYCDEITELTSALVLVYRTALQSEATIRSDAPWIVGCHNVVAHLRAERRAEFAEALANFDEHAKELLRQIEQYLLMLRKDGGSDEF